MTSYGASYEEFTKLFTFEAEAITPSALYDHLGLATLVLLVIAFFSLSMAMLVNMKNKAHVSYVVNCLIASVAIGCGSILVSNYVGVYI